MGVNVVLMRVEQQGSSPRRRRLTYVDAATDDQDRFARLCESSELPMLSRVDPYRTLVLSSVEMEQFISEVEVELGRSADRQVRDGLTEIHGLARECAADRATELHLVGD